MTETQETPAIRADGGGAGGEALDEAGQGADRGVARNGAEPSHHARRPMNAFLIFCKRHRSVVRDKYPNLENRSITKILGEWWANLDKDEKACYTGLAKQYKDAFFTAHPNFKWYKLPAPPLRTFATRPGNIGGPTTEREMYIENELCEIKVEQTNNNHLTKVNYNAQPSTSTSKDFHDGKKQMFTPGKLADEAQMGGLSSLIVSNNKHREEDYANERNFTPQSPTTGVNMPHLETPKFKSSSSNMTPNPPKKRPFSESDNTADRNNFYRSEDVSPPSRNMSSAEESKIQKLQDALSETSRMLELSFDSSYESEKCDEKSTLNIQDCPKNISQLNNAKEFEFAQNVSAPGFHELAFKHRGSLSSDESQDKECQQLDDLHLFDKSKGSWNSYIEHAQSKVSGRACKGKRYQEFMAFGGLIVNKRQKKEHMERKSSHIDSQSKLSYEVNSPTCSWKIYENYPKDIASRAEGNENEPDVAYCERVDLSESAYKFKKDTDDTGQVMYYNENTAEHAETPDGQGNKMFTADDFDLDAKIMALPSLSLEKFQQRKKENKKRKKNLSSKSKDARPRMASTAQYYPPESAGGMSSSRPAGSHATFSKQPVLLDKDAQSKRDLHQNISIDERMFLAEQRKSAIIGSKKRKPRKFSITRLDVNNSSTCKDKMEPAKNTCTNLYNPDLKPTSTNRLMPDQNTNENVDLCGLATLAEVAANTSKINEHI